MKYSIDIEYFTFSGQARLHKASTVREAGAFADIASKFTKVR